MTSKRVIKPNDAIIRGGFTEFKQLLGDSLREQIPVLVGNPDTGDIYVDSNTQTEIYVHDDGSTISGVSIISASGIDSQYIKYKQPILVKLTASGVYQFAGIDSQSDATYSAGSGDTTTQQPVHLNQLDYGTIHPYSGLQVLVKSADYNGDFVNDLIADAFDGTAQDTSMASITVPSTNNRQIAVLIQMDATTGALEYKQSAQFSAAISKVNALVNGLVPTRDASRFRVGYVFLKAGASTITYDNILSLPEFITSNEFDGATTALDNLASVAINTSLISDTHNTDDLGSTSIYWRVGYIGRTHLVSQSEPSTPAGGTAVIWADGTDKVFKFKNDAGTVYTLGDSDLVEISSAELGSSAASISITSIPATYQDLILVVKARADATAGAGGNIDVGFNSDTGNSYAENNSTVGSTGTETHATAYNQTAASCLNCLVGSNGDSGHFGMLNLVISAYSNSAISRTGVYQGNAYASATVMSRAEGSIGWENVAAAISSIQLTPSVGNFDTGTQWILYGLGTAV